MNNFPPYGKVPHHIILSNYALQYIIDPDTAAIV